MENHPEVLSQASRNNVIVRQNILEKVGHRKAANQIDVEQKAATSKLNDEMRKMRKSLLPSVEIDGKSKKRGSLHRGYSTQGTPSSSFTGRPSFSQQQQQQMNKRTEKRAKSDGAILGGAGESGYEGAHAGRNSFPQGLPAINNKTQSRNDATFAPMTYWGLRQQKLEEEKEGKLDDRRASLDKDLEERLKSFVVGSPRSTSIDATSSFGQKVNSPRDRSSLSGAVGGGNGASRRGSSFGPSGRKSGVNSSLTADAGLSPQQVLWLKRLAPKESSFYDEGVDDGDFENGNSPGLNEIKEDDDDDEGGFPLSCLPPTRLPPIYKIQPKMIENQSNVVDENPVKQNLRSSLPSPVSDWDSMKNTRYLRPKAKRIQEWYDVRSKHGPR